MTKKKKSDLCLKVWTAHHANSTQSAPVLFPMSDLQTHIDILSTQNDSSFFWNTGDCWNGAWCPVTDTQHDAERHAAICFTCVGPRWKRKCLCKSINSSYFSTWLGECRILNETCKVHLLCFGNQVRFELAQAFVCSCESFTHVLPSNGTSLPCTE